MGSQQELNRGKFVGNAVRAQDDRVRRKLRPVAVRIGIPLISLVIEDYQGAALLYVIQQMLIGGNQFGMGLVAAIINDDRVVRLEITGLNIFDGQLL